MSINCIRCMKNRRTGTDLLCDECRTPFVPRSSTPAEIAALNDRLQAKAEWWKPARCDGCGLPSSHKMCPAHGTAAYCKPDHPAWGDEDAIEALKGPATKRCRVPGCRNKFGADDDSMYCPSCVQEFRELEQSE